MADAIHIDAQTFRRRVKHLQQLLQHQSSSLFNNASCILVVVGKSDDERPFQKSSVLHTWLLGYEFPSTLLLITKQKVIFVTSASKAKHLDPLVSPNVEILSRTKDQDHNKKLFTHVIEQMEPVVGVFPKDQFKGSFIDEWNQALESNKDFKYVDASLGLSTACEIKDPQEVKTTRIAAKASQAFLSNYLSEEIFRVIDDESKVAQSKLSEQVEEKIDDDKFIQSKVLKPSPDFDPSQLEWCYTPIIQSGGDYDLRPSAMSSDNPLDPGVVVCSLGLRYKSYCANIGRTYLVDPSKDQQDHYSLLVKLEKNVLDSIRDGVVAKDVYDGALQYLHKNNPKLESHFLKNIGWGMGIEFRDSTMVLNGKCSRILRDGMILCIYIGFQDLVATNNKKKYSLLLVDTVRVTKDGPPLVFTESPKSLGDVSYYFEGDEEEQEDKKTSVKQEFKTKNGSSSSKNARNEASRKEQQREKEKAAGRDTRNRSAVVLKSKLRGETRSTDEGGAGAEARRKERQKELHAKLQQEGLARYEEVTNVDGQEKKPVFKRFESYKREQQLPQGQKSLRILVDPKAQTIILPISGRPVPFHINSLKNVSKNEEGDYVYLRLNFNAPGQAGSSNKEEMPFEDPNAQFVRSLTFRSRDVDRMHDIFKSIQEMKKESIKRETEKKQLQDVVDQGKLIEQRGHRPLRLESVFARPGPDSKRMPGYLEIHQNGIRYQSVGKNEHRIDVLFSNIKHLFFQPCDHELIALIHANLKNPIMIGKRKTKDVQFYREASDAQFDETGNRKRKYRYGDEDELEAEQEEKRRRQALNKEFSIFADKIADASNGQLDVDVPIRDLGFNGVPFRANVFCQPTTDCLVQLIDPPFLVITLSEVETVHFERIQFGLKNFDLVFVFKDFNKPVNHINSIPMDQLDIVKDWLNEVEIPYSEGPLNLNWPTIMKTLQADPHAFFENGGWSFLDTDSDSENGSGDSDSAESGFQPSDTDPEDETEESEFDQDDDDDDDEPSADESGDQSGGDFDEDDDDED